MQIYCFVFITFVFFSHLEAHSERENFLCERCDAEFTQKDRERVHSLAKVNFGTKNTYYSEFANRLKKTKI